MAYLLTFIEKMVGARIGNPELNLPRSPLRVDISIDIFPLNTHYRWIIKD